MALSRRLSVIASLVEKGARIADIGSDHCALPIFLFEKGTIDFALAVENKKGPFERMKKEIDKSGFPIVPSFSSGLSALPSKVDTLILAGMGGELIRSILSEGENKLENVKTIITDAHREREKVLSWMEENRFKAIDGEFILEKGIPYEIIKWQRTCEEVSYSDKERFFGPIAMRKKGKEWFDYLSKAIANDEKILLSLPVESPKRKRLTQEIEMMKEEMPE